VREGLLDEWVERWRSDIVPLRLKLGFEIGGAWGDRERNQFVRLVSYEGLETSAERNAMYGQPGTDRQTPVLSARARTRSAAL
jgi:hypothetical protein